jgi:hypothetical protein
MKQGRRLAAAPDLDELRRYAAGRLGQLPERLRALETVPAYEVRISPALQMLTKTVDPAPNIS